MSKDVAAAIDRNFTSSNVSDSNLEEANIVDTVASVASGLRKVAHAITPLDGSPVHTDTGVVGSLTESMIEVAVNLGNIAAAINNLADAVRETKRS